ncbi:exo-alpha-sialidase [Arenibacter sp. F26102]|uniref:exo-alpha-sialidase n=1 Tax=Arenibacter sp. F26102 TaxID=2926416 RepID=UPI001FF507EA|nr:exo-alpha-sialidase [Arenibacter sp. F26102]MCK0147284.1 exo-alpha-sialidase [Arenibacter sp. F26102]
MKNKLFSQLPNWLIGVLLLGLLSIGIFMGIKSNDNQHINIKNQQTIKRVSIADASIGNSRNDQSTMIRLNDGRLLVAYSHFGSTSKDHDKSAIYFQTSADDGDTWSTKEELIATISLGTYIPSLYKKENGNVLLIFSVKESIEPNTTSIRQIEFSPDLTSTVVKEHVLVSGGYFPTGSDRLFYDKVREKLLMPYQVLIEGPGWSVGSKYHTQVLVSGDDGDSWEDSGIIIEGFLDDKGLGGAMEPGIYKNKDRLTVYSRNLIGKVGACDIVWDGKGYSKDKEYKMRLEAKNAMSSIKYIKLIRGWIATYTRLRETDTPISYNRAQIDVSFSSNGLDWKKVFTVDDIEQVGGDMINEPNIFIEDNRVFITYSITGNVEGTYDLKLLQLPLTVF